VPWFHDLPFDETTQRHRLVFVNQQYDVLLVISWDDEAGDYELWGAEDEAAAAEVLAGSGSSEFDLAEYLEIARTRLPELDRKREADAVAAVERAELTARAKQLDEAEKQERAERAAEAKERARRGRPA
jgi:hypothetical protein